MGFLGGASDNLLVNVGYIRDTGSIPGLGKSPGGGNGNPTSIHAWKIPRTEEPGGYSPWGLKELDTTEHAHMHAKIPLRASPLIRLTILCFKCWKCSREQNKSQQSLCIRAAPTSLRSPWRRFTFSFVLCKQLIRMYRDQGIFYFIYLFIFKFYFI